MVGKLEYYPACREVRCQPSRIELVQIQCVGNNGDLHPFVASQSNGREKFCSGRLWEHAND